MYYYKQGVSQNKIGEFQQSRKNAKHDYVRVLRVYKLRAHVMCVFACNPMGWSLRQRIPDPVLI
jgi:hypothetical protein